MSVDPLALGPFGGVLEADFEDLVRDALEAGRIRSDCSSVEP